MRLAWKLWIMSCFDGPTILLHLCIMLMFFDIQVHDGRVQTLQGCFHIDFVLT